MTLLGDVIGSGTLMSRPTAGTEGCLYYATDTGRLYRDNGADWEMIASGESAIEFVIDGGGSVITTGIKGDVEVPFSGTIVACTMLADRSGSIVVDIWKKDYANFPPTDADSITAAAPPTIGATVKSQDTTLTGWTTALTKGQVLRYNVDSCIAIERCTVSLLCVKG